MLTSAWFLFGVMSQSPGAMAAGQVAFILTPPLAMGFLLTSSPRRTLRLYWPKGRYLALAIGLVLALNPLVSELRMVVEYLFPIPQTVREALTELMVKMPSAWTAVLLMALVPAVCEETAFRGYILSGLERTYRTRSAIILSALLFGFLHVLLSLFQQLFNAVLLGLVLALLAVRSRSLLPGIVFHFLNNALVLLHAFPTAEIVGPGLADWLTQHHVSSWLYRNPAEGLYRWPWLVAGAVAAAGMLVVLARTDAKEPARQPDPLAEPVAAP
jgi:sodium transport system permease protein